MLDFRLGLTMDWFGRKQVKIVVGAKDLEVAGEGLAFTITTVCARSSPPTPSCPPRR